MASSSPKASASPWCPPLDLPPLSSLLCMPQAAVRRILARFSLRVVVVFTPLAPHCVHAFRRVHDCQRRRRVRPVAHPLAASHRTYLDPRIAIHSGANAAHEVRNVSTPASALALAVAYSTARSVRTSARGAG